MKLLKQSTATTLLLGPFVDETDGQTAETALTISQADVLLWKEGGTTLAQKNESTSCTHRSNGLYTCPIDTTDTNTLGVLVVSVDEGGALPVRHDYFVVPAAVYDALKGGTGNGVRADVQAIAAGAADTIWDEPVPEASAVPNASTGTGRQIIGYLLAMMVNKMTSNKTTKVETLRNRADNASISTRTHADDATTSTKGVAS